MKIKPVIIDTNVFISAALVAYSTAAKSVDKVLQEYRIFFTEATFAELESRLWRPKFDRYLSRDTRRLLLHDLAAVADWCETPSASEQWCRDPDDDKFLQLALTVDAAFLVTGDKDLLVLADTFDVPILTPAEALAHF